MPPRRTVVPSKLQSTPQGVVELLVSGDVSAAMKVAKARGENAPDLYRLSSPSAAAADRRSALWLSLLPEIAEAWIARRPRTTPAQRRRLTQPKFDPMGGA